MRPASGRYSASSWPVPVRVTLGIQRVPSPCAVGRFRLRLRSLGCPRPFTPRGVLPRATSSALLCAAVAIHLLLFHFLQSIVRSVTCNASNLRIVKDRPCVPGEYGSLRRVGQGLTTQDILSHNYPSVSSRNLPILARYRLFSGSLYRGSGGENIRARAALLCARRWLLSCGLGGREGAAQKSRLKQNSKSDSALHLTLARLAAQNEKTRASACALARARVADPPERVGAVRPRRSTRRALGWPALLGTLAGGGSRRCSPR